MSSSAILPVDLPISATGYVTDFSPKSPLSTFGKQSIPTARMECTTSNGYVTHEAIAMPKVCANLPFYVRFHRDSRWRIRQSSKHDNSSTRIYLYEQPSSNGYTTWGELERRNQQKPTPSANIGDAKTKTPLIQSAGAPAIFGKFSISLFYIFICRSQHFDSVSLQQFSIHFAFTGYVTPQQLSDFGQSLHWAFLVQPISSGSSL